MVYERFSLILRNIKHCSFFIINSENYSLFYSLISIGFKYESGLYLIMIQTKFGKIEKSKISPISKQEYQKYGFKESYESYLSFLKEILLK